MQPNPMTTEERRHKEPPIPEHLDRYLNQQQMNALTQVENFGWRMAFVRRPMFQPVLAVLQNSDNPGRYAVLRDDGEIDFDPQVTIRH